MKTQLHLKIKCVSWVNPTFSNKEFKIYKIKVRRYFKLVTIIRILYRKKGLRLYRLRLNRKCCINAYENTIVNLKI